MANLFDAFIKKIEAVPQQVGSFLQSFNQPKPAAPAPRPVPTPTPNPFTTFKPTYQQASQIKPYTPIPVAPYSPKQAAQGAVKSVSDTVKNVVQDFIKGTQDEPGTNFGFSPRAIGEFSANAPGTGGAEHLAAGGIGLLGGFIKNAPKVEKLAKEEGAVAKGTKVVVKTGQNILEHMPKEGPVKLPKIPNPSDLTAGAGSLEQSVSQSVNKVISAIREAKPVRETQEALYTAARSQKLAKVINIRKQGGGESGFFKELGALKGELPKATYESVRGKVTQQDIDTLYNGIKNTTKIDDWEKVNAQVGLTKLFGKAGGEVPTRGELHLLQQVYGNDFVKTLLDKRPGMQKFKDAVVEGLNLPRALTSSLDLSAPLRQGIFLVGRPKQWIPAFTSMFKQFASPQAFEDVQNTIKQMPTYQAMKDHGLALTEMGSSLGPREETFMSNLSERIPVIGKGVAASNRAYSGFLNKLRADTFNDIATKAGNTSPDFYKSLADYVNSATGRGNLPAAIEKFAPAANAAFFSPRLIASRLNLMNPKFYAGLDPTVRKEAIKDLFKTTGLIMSTLGLAKLGGAQVVTDPTNADFGKIKVGNTRYEITGGFTPYIRLIAQLQAGKITSSTTGKTITLGEGYKPITRYDIITRFLQSKENPVLAFVTDLARETNNIGEPLDFKTLDPTKNEVLKNFVPLLLGDMRDAYQEWGAKGIGMAAPSIFGVGAQTYGGTPTTLGEAEQKGNVDLYKFLKSRPKDEANKYINDLQNQGDTIKANKLSKFKDIENAGLGEPEMRMVGTGVKDGERAGLITKQLNNLPTKAAKNDYLSKLSDLGIMTDEIYNQLAGLKDKGELKAPTD